MNNSLITRRITTTVLKNGIVIEIRITNSQPGSARATSGRFIRSSLPTSSLSNKIKLQSATNIRVNRLHLKAPRFVMIFQGPTQPPSAGNLNHSWTKTWEGFRR